MACSCARRTRTRKSAASISPRRKQSPGVIAIFTGADLAAENVGGLPCGWLIHSTDGKPMNEPPHPVIAHEKVRHVGDQVALVVAESIKEAKDALELIDVDYDVLPAVVDTAQRSRTRASRSCTTASPDNICYNWGHGDKAKTDAAFAQAAHVTTLDIVNQRLIPNAIEPRAVNASYSKHDESYTVYVANQNPHVERLLMAAFVLSLAGVEAADHRAGCRRRLRLEDFPVRGRRGAHLGVEEGRASDQVDGGALGSVPLRRPRPRSCDESRTRAGRATASSSRCASTRPRTWARICRRSRRRVPTILYATLLAGQYATPAIYAEVKAVFTNTVPVDAYRGAGRPEATYVVERLVETAAREMNIDPAEIRRRNFIREFPYATPVGLTYDTGDYEACLSPRAGNRRRERLPRPSR